MIEVLHSMSQVDAVLSTVAVGALVLVAYLAWARRRLARLQRADDIVSRVLSQEEVDRILRVAEELTRQGARRSEPSSS